MLRTAVFLCVCVFVDIYVCECVLPDGGMAHVSKCSLSELSLEQQAPVRLHQTHTELTRVAVAVVVGGRTRGFLPPREEAHFFFFFFLRLQMRSPVP